MTNPSSSSSLLSSTFFSRLRHGQLFLFLSACLSGQVSATWDWFSLSFWWICGLAILMFLAWRLYGRSGSLFTFCFLFVFIVTHVSLQRVLHPHFPVGHLRHLSLPQEVTIEGWLFREPERFPNRGRLYLETLRIWENGSAAPATGKILLTVRSLLGAWHYGDILRVSLKLRAPRNFRTPGSFDYERYLARHDIYLTAFLWDDRGIEQIGATRNSIQHRIEHLRRDLGIFFTGHLDSQTAAVLRALILGDQGLIENDLRQAFSRAGVTHVLSVSGLHIALVAATAYGGWWWVLGRSRSVLLTFKVPKLASLLTFPPVLFYAALAGGNVGTWRSVIMVFVYLLARIVDRHGDIYRSLAFAAIVISLIEPGAILDISFQLSFVSVFSIALGAGQLSSWWDQRNTQLFFHKSVLHSDLLRWGSTYGAVSIFALLGTAPLTAFHFNQISLAGLIANLIVVPLLGSAAVIFGLLTAAGFFLDSRIVTIFLWIAGFFTRIGNKVVLWFAALPYASLHVVTPSKVELLLLYTLLLCGFCRSLLPPRSFRRFVIVLLIGTLFDIGLWVSQRYFHHTLQVSFLDVGQGDAAVVELPDGRVMIIDGGGFASQDFDTGEAILAPFLWGRKIRQVDILVMSHPQLDHYGGLLYIAEHFSPSELWFNGEQTHGERFAKLMEVVRRKGIQLRILCREAPPPVLRDVSIQILHPPCHNGSLDTNNASLVLRLSYGTTDILFTGDIEAEGETTLLAAATAFPSEILKVPHHGSRTSSSPAFVRTTTPVVAVASLGADNRFRFPAKEVVQRYQEIGSQWLRTDQTGTVTIISDGRRYNLFTTLPLPSLRDRP